MALLLTFITALLMDGFSCPVLPPQATSRWAVIGHQEIKFLQDHEEIPIKVNDARLTAIRLSFQGETVNMHHCQITFENDETQTIPLKKSFKDGSVSKIIDLHGGLRTIKKFEYYYQPDRFAKNKAFVELIGKMEIQDTTRNGFP